MRLIAQIKSFLNLSDTPAAYPATPESELIVNAAEDAIEFGSPSIAIDGTRTATADISLGNNTIINMGFATAATDGASKNYVDSAVNLRGAGLVTLEYDTTSSYQVGEIITELGTMYRVTTAIPFSAAARIMAPYGSLKPLNLGTGKAWFKKGITADGSRDWLKVCAIKPYSTGTATINTLWSGMQSQVHIEFTTNYNSTGWRMMLTQHTASALDQISFRQDGVGTDIGLWLRVTDDGQTLDIHSIITCAVAGSSDDSVTLDADIDFVDTAGGTSSHFSYWNPGAITNGRSDNLT